MESFRVLVELLKTRLWDRDAAAVAGSAGDFDALLGDIQRHAAARLLASKPLDQPLTRRDYQSAKAFLMRIYDDEGVERKWTEKVSYFKQLDPESLAVAVILCNGDKALRHATDTIQALCQGVEKVAKWSRWPHDERLKTLVQKYRQQPASSSVTLPAQPSATPQLTPAQTKPVVLKCLSCGAPLDIELACKQATSGTVITQAPAPRPQGIRSLNVCPDPAPPSPALSSNVTILKKSFPEPKLGSDAQQPPGLGHTGPGFTPPPPTDQPNGTAAYLAQIGLIFKQPRPRQMIYRLGDFLRFTDRHLPPTIEFTLEALSLDSARYVSVRIRGVWFEVTPAWIEARGLRSSPSPLAGLASMAYIPRKEVLDGILSHLRETQSYGFQHMISTGGLRELRDLNIATLWWFGADDGDGRVWPNGFGELLVQWWRPSSCRDFLDWACEGYFDHR
ncbi:hypothetical protein F5144DRAFT_548717 [Chaetomium tenue]|uniref:Uncharacterized protein n=1 Tax=Chaetomium tenue TaxID=1854479 RepID=A0ACB7PBG1_9PEZI|nr:hypothetical protein F5144DRAFT_548717 [Chaetomium globosum]